MTRTAGWKWLEGRIQEEIRIADNDLRNIDPEGKTAEQIASEYLQKRADANAFRRVLGIAEEAIQQKDDAAEELNQ